MPVELVNVRTTDDVRLDGSLTLPHGASPPELGIDAAILNHGVGGNFYGPSFFPHMQQALNDVGCAVLRVNNRGHDLVYNTPSGRLGAAFEVVDDCRLDWKAWLDFAEARGYRRVLLWGHSLGAVKTIYFLAVESDPRVACAIASSPPLFSYDTYLGMEGSERFAEHFAHARTKVEQGAPDELMAMTVPTSAILAARTYVDKYGPEQRYNILNRLPAARVPVLVTLGGQEGSGPARADWLAFGGLAAKVERLAGETPNLSCRTIEDANHFYEGKEEELWEAARDWLGPLAVTTMA
ncbi:MAG: alpha/beta fold hydrolase [Chloroflexota bacterium]|nr:alpha/beta fold hydrolase [Chloroflexota bacterium]